MASVGERFVELDQRLRPGFVRRLQRFFSAQASRVVARYLALFASTDLITVQPAAEELLPEEERQRLWLVILPFIYTAIMQSANFAGDLVALEDLEDADPRIGELLNELNPRIAWIHRTTLDAVRATLADGASRGYTVAQIARGVPADGFRGLRIVAEVYQGRANTIARTELANARQLATMERYQEAGVAMVRVFDGTEPTICGWERHNDPDRADGSIRTLIAARAYPLAHPHCRRVFAPYRRRR